MKLKILSQTRVIKKIQKALVSEVVLQEGLSKWVLDEFAEFYVSRKMLPEKEIERLKPRLEKMIETIKESVYLRNVNLEEYSPRGILQFMSANWMYLIHGSPDVYHVIAEMLRYHDHTCKQYDKQTYEHINAVLMYPYHHSFFTGHFDEKLVQLTIIVG